jgi:phosphate starvation-inducible protein PhoH and related proteins
MPKRSPRDRKGSQSTESGHAQPQHGHNPKTGFGLAKIKPLTENQAVAFDSYGNGRNLMLHGVAGTGKTFIALNLALEDVLSGNNQKKKVIIVRSVVPTRDMGFLPGNQKEKSRVYESPYYSICNELFGRGDAYETLKSKGMIDFITTSFIRGITLDNCIVVVDESQNMAAQELHSIMTRVGQNCRIIFAGDTRQDDLTSVRKKEESGLTEFMRILRVMKSFDFVEFGEEDIVRSELVKEYIITRNKLGLDWH